MAQLTDTDFYRKYTPQHNEILLTKYAPQLSSGDFKRDDIAPFAGCMYETFGDELEFIKRQPANRVWTILDAEGELYIVAGIHIVNRMGYLVTDKEWENETEEYLCD